MRDRRNTNLSISISSQSSAAVSPVTLSDSDAAEKGRFLLLPEKTGNEPLPSPLLKHAQETQRRQPAYRRILAQASKQNIFVAVLFGTFFIWRAILLLSSLNLISLGSSSQYVLADGALASNDPEVVIVQNEQGQKKWTITIPANATFPLRPYQYRDLCSRSSSLRKRLASSAQQATHIAFPKPTTYTTSDPLFLDPSSRAASLLNPVTDLTPHIPVINASPDDSLPICTSSLTFLLETSEAGFGASLLSLWLSYGLARQENRAFFIDDSRWSYGKYSSYFPSPPVPKCTPPPPQHVAPCPHTARHLAVSAATLQETFGTSFHAMFEAKHHSGVAKQRKIFSMAREGYEALFGLSGEDREFASHRVRGIRDAAERRGQEVVGVHIRRGDRHPFEYEFQNDYLPLERFVNAAVESVDAGRRAHGRARSGGSVLTFATSTAGRGKVAFNESEPLTVYVASDDPDIVTSKDLAMLNGEGKFKLERAQERIVLASKNNLLPTVPERKGAFVKHIDQVSGWEGGFFASLFRGLGRPNRASHLTFSSAREHRLQMEERIRKEREGKELSEEEKRNEENAMAMRELVGRGYLLDLEVLGKSDRVVCAVSSATCRALGVVMGWDAVKNGRFVNVDDGRDWSWDGLH
ncbi:Ribosome bioproteinsis protein bms1 [Elsinoe australis]|uniref:Ribosome bioproteinsis protein bms1 n=1 Tax=Elsinoe australis TaxID=40998 RepID=A0A2P8A479_9PEZI|nr:Ribosome bioproteinsis protein bms1 [Elsinoe australis]